METTREKAKDKAMTSPGDFGTPEWINWSKWKRRGWLGIAIAAALFGIAYLWKAIPWLVENWPGFGELP